MFQTARMRKIKILSLNQYSDSIVQSLHEEGIVQIDDISERIQHDPKLANFLQPSKIKPLTGRLSSLLMKATGISELLGDALSGDTNIMDLVKSFISPVIPDKIEVENLSVEELIYKAEDLLDKVESQTKVIENRKNALTSRKSELESNINVAMKMSKLDIDLAALNDTKYTSTIVCGIDAESANKFKEKAVNVTDNLLILEEPNYIKDNGKFDEIIIIVTLNEFKDEIYSLLRKFDFEKYEIEGLSGKPNEIITSRKSELESLDKEEDDLNSKLKKIAEEWDDDVVILKEQLEIEKERSEIFATFGKTDKTVLLEAWVPLKDVDKVKSLIEQKAENYCEIEVEDIGEDDSDVPVLQNNIGYAKPYEYLIAMYAPLKYRELDPTIFMAIFFPFMFGFCLTDAFYAMLVTIMGIVAVKGMGKVRKSLHSLGWITIHCGIWGMILGFAANGFLGDFFPKYVIGNNVPIPTTIIDAFSDPVTVLILAIGVGILHINIATLMGIIDKFRYGQKKEALTENIVWLVLELGVVFLAAGMFVPSIGMIGMGIGGICVLVTVGLLFYGKGAFGVMDIFSYMGNILSYARLLALCLSTAGIAMTVNILANLMYEMIPIAAIGIVIAAIIFVFGHIANFLIQIVGGFINTMRLHFVEFFTHFYMGGHNAFKPFSSNRILTKLKK